MATSAAFRFDRDTAAQQRSGDTATVEFSDDWNVDGRIINGGYVQAAAVNAVRAVAGRQPDPVAVSTSYVSPARPGPAVVVVRLLRSGQTITAAEATVTQEHGIVLVSLVTLGVLDDPSGATQREPRESGAAALPMPAVAGPGESIRPPRSSVPGAPGLIDLVDMAFVPEASGWLTGNYAAGPRVLAWMGFTDGRPVDALALTALADMGPPVSFATGRFGWAPTLQLQVAVFARPSGSPVLLELRGEPYHGSFVAEDGTLWDSDGTVLARSRQIALPPRS